MPTQILEGEERAGINKGEGDRIIRLDLGLVAHQSSPSLANRLFSRPPSPSRPSDPVRQHRQSQTTVTTQPSHGRSHSLSLLSVHKTKEIDKIYCRSKK